MEEIRNEYNISIGKPEGKISLGGLRTKWENNTKIYV
jgi:hypothetical protein